MKNSWLLVAALMVALNAKAQFLRVRNVPVAQEDGFPSAISSFCNQAHDRSAFHLSFRDENGLILLDLKVNEKPAVLLLDTGATTTLFATPGLVEIRVADHSVFAVHANELGRFNSTTRKNLALLGISGILGQDFLHKFKSVRIDYANRVLELEPR